MPLGRARITLLAGLLLPACSGVPANSGKLKQTPVPASASAGSQPADRASIKVDGVAAFPGGFALWNATGSLEFVGMDGTRVATTETGVVGVSEVARSWNGWLVRGSQMKNGGEVGAIALVSDAGVIVNRWTVPGLFWSMTALQDRSVATDHAGQLFSLEGSPLPEPLLRRDAASGPVEVRQWSGELATCTTGSRRFGGNPEATCTRAHGPPVRGIWRGAPIGCGAWLVADTQESAAADSPWTRTVWSAQSGAKSTSKNIQAPAVGFQCADGLLIDTTPPGAIYQLPTLELRTRPLCELASIAHISTAGRSALCVEPDGHLHVRAHAF